MCAERGRGDAIRRVAGEAPAIAATVVLQTEATGAGGGSWKLVTVPVGSLRAARLLIANVATSAGSGAAAGRPRSAGRQLYSHRQPDPAAVAAALDSDSVFPEDVFLQLLTALGIPAPPTEDDF